MTQLQQLQDLCIATYDSQSSVQAMISIIKTGIDEFDNTVNELLEMSVSNQGYSIVISDRFNIGAAEGSVRGGSEYNLESGLFEMTVPLEGGRSLLAHELKHGYQFEIGEFSNSPKTLYDLDDEVEAYRRQSFFGGGIVSLEEIKSNYPFLGPKRFGVHKQIDSIGPQRIANMTQAAFRVNGITIIPFTPISVEPLHISNKLIGL